MTGISSFADHPEFQIRRAFDASSQSRRAAQVNHQAFRLAEPPPLSADGSTASWEWTDKANFKFNHKQHLMEGGVPIPANHPSNKGQDEPRKTKVLSCADCHEMDDKGEYFRPIHYERHCADCHELSFRKELSEVGLPGTDPEPLPHEKPEIIRGTLRDRLTSYINNHPDLLDSSASDAVPFNPLPHTEKLVSGPKVQEKAEWVENQLEKIEGIVKGERSGADLRTIQNGCLKCHFVEPSGNPKGVNWDVLPPNIPDRWLPHSRFKHDRHDMLECYDCHHVRPPEDKEAFGYRDDPGSIFQSDKAEHILMPSIAMCRTCHGSPVGTPLPGALRLVMVAPNATTIITPF